MESNWGAKSFEHFHLHMQWYVLVFEFSFFVDIAMQHNNRSVLDNQDFVQIGALIDLSWTISALTWIILIQDLYSFIPKCRFKIGDLHLLGSLIVLFESSFGSPNLAK